MLGSSAILVFPVGIATAGVILATAFFVLLVLGLLLVATRITLCPPHRAIAAPCDAGTPADIFPNLPPDSARNSARCMQLIHASIKTI
jgi:hypothetical protein